MTAKVQKITLQASAAQTASNNSASQSVGIRREMLLLLNVTAASGTSPTLNVKLQTTDDAGATWYDVPGGAFTQATTTGTQALALTAFGDTVRASSTIGGTSPSFTYAVKAVMK